MRPQRYQQIDAVKGWAIIGVIFAHMSFTSRFRAEAIADVHLLQHVFGWCVLAFFFCSGFLYGSAKGVAAPVRSFLRKRARKLLVPWFCLSVLYAVLLRVARHFHFLHDTGSLQNGPGISLFAELWNATPQLYFLVYLFAVSLLFHLFLQGKPLRREWLLWLILAALAQNFWLCKDEPYGADVNRLPAYLASYLMGILLTRPSFILPVRHPILRKTGLLLLLIFYATLCFFRPMALQLAVPPLLFGVGAIGGFPLKFAGSNSGAIYAWHTPIVMPCLSIVLVKYLTNPWSLIFNLAMLTMVISLGVARLVGLADKRRLLTL